MLGSVLQVCRLSIGFMLLAAAPVVGQDNVGAGERRFNRFVYKASHNSYERNEPLNAQIDDYNVWCVELDMWWENSGCDISIEHFCGSPHDAQPLTVELAEIAASVTAASRFTVIYLEMKDPGLFDFCYSDWPGRATYRQCIHNAIAGAFPLPRVYTAGEFVSSDLSRWPSYQELVRRGKNYMIILDEVDVGGPFADDFFFGATETNPPPGNAPANTVLVNVNGGCDSSPGTQGPGLVNDRWLYRAYPGGTCDFCGEQNGAYWTQAVGLGFNFIATNCVEDAHSFDPATHSPAPLYVMHDDTGLSQYGSLGFPSWGTAGLLEAFGRVSPMVDVRIQSGDYDVPDGTVIDRPMRLTTQGGSVTIR